MTEQGTSYAFGGCRDSKNVVSEDLDWSVQLVIYYKLSPFRAELLTIRLANQNRMNTLKNFKAHLYILL